MPEQKAGCPDGAVRPGRTRGPNDEYGVCSSTAEHQAVTLEVSVRFRPFAPNESLGGSTQGIDIGSFKLASAWSGKAARRPKGGWSEYQYPVAS